MSWIPDTPGWTVGQLVARGLKVDEACWMVYDGAALPASLKEKPMIRIGDVHCHHCGDEFEPDGLPSFEGPNFCSVSCEEFHDDERSGRQAYDEARYGAAQVF